MFLFLQIKQSRGKSDELINTGDRCFSTTAHMTSSLGCGYSGSWYSFSGGNQTKQNKFCVFFNFKHLQKCIMAYQCWGRTIGEDSNSVVHNSSQVLVLPIYENCYTPKKLSLVKINSCIDYSGTLKRTHHNKANGQNVVLLGRRFRSLEALLMYGSLAKSRVLNKVLPDYNPSK